MKRVYKTGKENASFKDRVGERHLTKEGYWITIIEYFGRHNCIIQFEDGTILKKTQYYNICKGSISNPYHPSVCGVGYYGIGKYNSVTDCKKYTIWSDMIRRGYSKEFKLKNISYKEVLVHNEWHNFQVFAGWFEKHHKEDFELDKDILIKGNKIYSSETCCFVPQEINNLFVKNNKVRGKLPIGVSKNGKKYIARVSKNGIIVKSILYITPEEAFYAYKDIKEQHIKEVADKWRGQITEPCYEAMYNYEVEITD